MLYIRGPAAEDSMKGCETRLREDEDLVPLGLERAQQPLKQLHLAAFAVPAPPRWGRWARGRTPLVMRSGWLQFLRICISTLFSLLIAAPRCPSRHARERLLPAAQHHAQCKRKVSDTYNTVYMQTPQL